MSLQDMSIHLLGCNRRQLSQLLENGGFWLEEHVKLPWFCAFSHKYRKYGYRGGMETQPSSLITLSVVRRSQSARAPFSGAAVLDLKTLSKPVEEVQLLRKGVETRGGRADRSQTLFYWTKVVPQSDRARCYDSARNMSRVCISVGRRPEASEWQHKFLH